MTERDESTLSMFTVYQVLTGYEVVEWWVEPGKKPEKGQRVDVSPDLEQLRRDLEARGLTVIPRQADDAPDIVETWF